MISYAIWRPLYGGAEEIPLTCGFALIIGVSHFSEKTRGTMNDRAILDIKPEMIAVSDGSWLAVAGPGAPVQCGVLEPTQSEARLRFAEAIQRIVSALRRGTEELA
jgi:hypothetical protein